MKTALIFGVTGQAGSYLAEHLLAAGYIVHGVKRRTSTINTGRIDHLYQDTRTGDTKIADQCRLFVLHYGDVTDPTSVINLIKQVQPDEIYNLAAQSHVHVSFATPGYTADATAIGVLNILEAIRILDMCDKVRFLQASSSEMYGKVQETPQTETTPFYPRSPYAVAKLFGYWSTVNYREAYGLFACNAICFNMESPRRGETFVTRKITRGIAAIIAGKQDCIYLGNINAKRDWGHAKDYAKAMMLMLQNKHADDFVIATGKTWTVRHFLQVAFQNIGIELAFCGTGLEETAIVQSNAGIYKKQFHINKTVLRIDADYYRPTEVDILLGDATKARSVLNWQPEYNFLKMVNEMVFSDIAEL